MLDSASERNPVEELAEEFVQRYRRGERPALSEYTNRYPALADEIRDLFPALLMMEEVRPSKDEATGPYPGGPPQAKRLERLGDYRILRELGRGGMGIVYEAEQESLGRHVALKLLPGHALLDLQRLRRFQREARAAARLHHTNIVPVFGVGEEAGTHYYVMQYIAGQGLDQVLAELRKLRRPHDGPGLDSRVLRRLTETVVASDVAQALVSGAFASSPEGRGARGEGRGEQEPQPAAPEQEAGSRSPASPGESVTLSETGRRYWQGVARIGIQVADALAYAHSQGVLHRDIKPSNLLLDTQGTVWVTDFGLAKAADSDDLTGPGDIVGTVRYMAPERFQGQADERSDVYGLGITLYELLTLRPAFEASERSKLMAQVLHGELARPRKVNPAVPRDLETIVLKATAREPVRRYASAAELAADLTRFTQDRPIRARRVSVAERLWRWSCRNPAVASMAGAILFLLLVLLAGSLIESARLARAFQEQQAKLWESLHDRARALRRSRQPGQRLEALQSIREALRLPLPPGHTLAELRTEAVAALALPDVEVEREWEGGLTPGIVSVAFAANLEQYARLAQDGTVTVFRIRDDAILSHWKEATDGAWPVSDKNLRFSCDGRYLAVWHPHARRLVVRRIDGPEPAISSQGPLASDSYDLAPDSRTLACLLPGGRIAVTDLASGRVRFLPSNGAEPYWLVFAPDSRRFAIGVQRAGKYAVEVWDLSQGDVLARLPLQAARVFPFLQGWHPDGRTLATGVSDRWDPPAADPRAIQLWDIPSGTLLRTLVGHKSVGICCAFDAAGQWLASDDWQATLRLWELTSGRQLLSFPAGADLLHLTPDKRLAVSKAGDPRKLQLLRLRGNQEYRTLALGIKPGWGKFSTCFHPGGRLLALAADTHIALVDLTAGREVAGLPTTGGGPLLWEPDGALLTAGYSGLVRWPVRSSGPGTADYRFGPAERLLTEGTSDRWGVSALGQIVAIPEYNRGALVVRRGPAPERINLGPLQDVRCCSLSPDGRWLATGSHTNTDGFGARVWEAATGRPVQALSVPGMCQVQFSPDGRWLLTTGGGLRLCAVGTWSEGPAVGEGNHACFSPDGQLLAVEGLAGTVRLVETATGKELVRLEAPEQSRLIPLAFSPDGGRLTVGGEDTEALHIWDLREVRRQLVALDLDWDAPPMPPPAKAESPHGLAPLQIDVETRGRLHAAAAVLAQSFLLAQNPLHFLPYLRRGQAYATLGDIERACADYRTAWVLLPAATRQRIGPGPILQEAAGQRGDLSEAYVRALARVLQMADTEDVRCNGGAWLRVTGRHETRDLLLALALAERAVSLNPQQRTYQNTLGLVYYRLGWYAPAVTALEYSLEQNSEAAYDLFVLAMCFWEQGDEGKARAYYERANRWLEQHEAKLASAAVEELHVFQAEVDDLLKKKSEAVR
jgi:serine/threonine protein kinase/WD40 repeat protein/tetratricopeptide (TPR) repeat protein